MAGQERIWVGRYAAGATLRNAPAPARAANPGVDGFDRMAAKILFGWLIASIVLQRFAFVAGAGSVWYNYALVPIAIPLLLLTGRLVFHPHSLGMTMLFLAILLPSQGILATSLSPGSLLLFLGFAIPYVFRIEPGLDLYPYIIRRFRLIATILACLGIYQFVGQFVLPKFMIFPIDELVPVGFLKRGYNVVIPLSYGASVYKANGVFMLEPSLFSQLLALAITVELLYFNSVRRLSIYATALVMSFSGTGLLVLALTLPLILVRASVNIALSIAGAGVAVLIIASIAAPEMIEAYTARFNEFTVPGTSGYARFTMPAIFAWQEISSGRVMIGLGAGGIDDFKLKYGSELSLFDPTWFKLLLEYGLPTWLLFNSVLLHRLVLSSRSSVLGFAQFVLFAVTGGYLIDPNQHALLLVLMALHGNKVLPNARRLEELPGASGSRG